MPDVKLLTDYYMKKYSLLIKQTMHRKKNVLKICEFKLRCFQALGMKCHHDMHWAVSWLSKKKRMTHESKCWMVQKVPRNESERKDSLCLWEAAGRLQSIRRQTNTNTSLTFSNFSYCPKTCPFRNIHLSQ